jgi:hypothetical protein
MTRRTAIWLGLGGVPASWAFGPGEFWDSKDPAEWSEKEARRVLSRSPWAKEVTIPARDAGNYGDMAGSGGGARAGGMGGGGMGGAGVGGGGMGGGGMGGGGSRSRGADSASAAQLDTRALVRWESAVPVSQAEHKPLPPEATNYYVVSVTELPVRDRWSQEDPEIARREMQDSVIRSTALQRKGKDDLHPERLEMGEKDGQRIVIFYFARSVQPITIEDKEVSFTSTIGIFEVRARFPLKEMVYRGRLEL